MERKRGTEEEKRKKQKEGKGAERKERKQKGKKEREKERNTYKQDVHKDKHRCKFKTSSDIMSGFS